MEIFPLTSRNKIFVLCFKTRVPAKVFEDDLFTLMVFTTNGVVNKNLREFDCGLILLDGMIYSRNGCEAILVNKLVDNNSLLE